MKEYGIDVAGHRLVISADEALGFQAAMVLGAFADVANEWRDGLTIQVGWGVFKLASAPSGYRVLAPDYPVEPPISFVEDATLPLWILAGQAAASLKTEIEPQPCKDSQLMAYHRDALHASKCVFWRRETAYDRDSGWYLAPYGYLTEPAPDELKFMHTFQLARVRPALMRMLQFPEGTMVFATDNTIDQVIGPGGKVLIEGPY